jgi:hypothetical protein
VFVRGDRHRRVIGVIDSRVVYCFGGNHNRSCALKTWNRWVKGARG